MSVQRTIGIIGALLVSGFLQAKPAMDFSTEQNNLCWKMMEQKAVGHCKLHFERSNSATVEFAPREEISRAFSRYFTARTDFPTSFQQAEFAIQFMNYAVEKYPLRDSLNYIRTDDGKVQLTMTILTSKTGGYSFVLADTDAHFRQVTDALQRPKARPATQYYRSIAKLFAE